MARMKGTTLQPNIDWIEKTYGAGTWAGLLGDLPESERTQLQNVQSANWYSMASVGTAIRTLVATRIGSDRGQIEQAFRSMGAYIAEDSLSGIYSIFVRIASPERVLGRLPNVVKAVYEGVDITVDIAEDRKFATARMTGMGELPYAGPRLCGWGQRAMEKAGAKGVRVVERSWQAGKDSSDDITLEITWS